MKKSRKRRREARDEIMVGSGKSYVLWIHTTFLGAEATHRLILWYAEGWIGGISDCDGGRKMKKLGVEDNS
jgi:hypothetical protein